MAHPKTLGACIDKLYKLKQDTKIREAELKKTTLYKRIAADKAKFAELQEHIIQTFEREKANGASGKVGKLSISKSDTPAVEDWDTFYKYVSKTKSFDLLQKRCSSPAFKARWAEGKTIPGVKKYPVIKISLTKV